MNILPSLIRRRLQHHPGLVEVLDNIGWLVADKIIRLGLGLFVVAWMARYLGPEQFGLLNYAIALVAIFGAIASVGLNGIVVRDLVKEPEDSGCILGAAFVLQLSGGVIAIVLTLLTAYYMGPEDNLTKTLVAILGFSLIFRSSDVIKYWFESQLQSRYTVWIENSIFIFVSAIKIVCILNNSPLIVFAWILLAESILVFFGLFSVYGKKIGKLNTWNVQFRRVKHLLMDSWPLITSTLSIIAYMKIDQVMIGNMLGGEKVGIYSAAVKISEVWYFIPLAINASLMPKLMRIKKDSESRYFKFLQLQLDALVFISIIVAIAVTFLSKFIIMAVYGGVYIDAADVLIVHIWTGIFYAINNAVWSWYLAENIQGIANIRIIAGLSLNVLLNYILIRTNGILGAAIATLISRILVSYIGQLFHNKTNRLFFLITKSLLTFGARFFININKIKYQKS